MSKYIVEREKQHFDDLGGTKSAWHEGYLSALANYKLITESEFDELMEHLKSGWLEHSAQINTVVSKVNELHPTPLSTRIMKRVGKILFPFKF